MSSLLLAVLFLSPLQTTDSASKGARKSSGRDLLSRVEFSSVAPEKPKSLWKDTKLDSVRRLLLSANPKDVIDGLRLIDTVEWEKVRSLVLPLIYHLDDTISELVLQIAVKRREKIASALLRQRVVFAFTPKEKITAIQMLASLANPDDFGFFNRLLRYQNLKVRLAVIKVIGQLKIHGSISPLVRLLGDSREQVRLDVIDALGKIGSRQVEIPLISKLSDTSSRVRIAAVEALSKFKSKAAKLALLRLLRTGNARERLSVLKTLPPDKSVTAQLKTILRTGSQNERVEAISLLKGRLDNEMLLLLASLTTYYKYQNVITQMAGKAIKPKNLSLIKAFLERPNLDYSRRQFFSLMAATSGLSGAIPLIRRLYNQKKIPDHSIVTIMQHASSGEAVAFQIELFKSIGLAYKKTILKNFIERRDDRLAPAYLAIIKHEPTLKKHLLSYANATGSGYFVPQLLAWLGSDSYKNKSGLLAALQMINSPKALGAIITAGPSLTRENLATWSNIIHANLTQPVVNQLAQIPIAGEAHRQELHFLFTVAYLKGLKLPAKARSMTPRKNWDYDDLWLWAASRRRAPSVHQIPSKLRHFALDLLPLGTTPKGLAALFKDATPQLFQSLVRFTANQNLLLRGLSSSSVCTRVNATIGARHVIAANATSAWRFAKREVNPFVRFNVILQAPYTKALGRLADRLRSTGAGIPDWQWRVLLSRWPAKVASRYAKKWELSPLSPDKSPKTDAIRFSFHEFPKNLTCVLVSMPQGGFQAVTPSPSGNLVMLKIPKGKVSLHPVLSFR